MSISGFILAILLLLDIKKIESMEEDIIFYVPDIAFLLFWSWKYEWSCTWWHLLMRRVVREVLQCKTLNVMYPITEAKLVIQLHIPVDMYNSQHPVVYTLYVYIHLLCHGYFLRIIHYFHSISIWGPYPERVPGIFWIRLMCTFS